MAAGPQARQHKAKGEALQGLMATKKLDLAHSMPPDKGNSTPETTTTAKPRTPCVSRTPQCTVYPSCCLVRRAS